MRLRNDVSVSFNKQRNRWLVRWYGKFDTTTEKQPRYCKTFKRKRDAEKFAQSQKNDIYDGISVEPTIISLGNLTNNIIKAKKGNLSPDTIDAYQDTIKRLINYFGSHRNIKTISPQEAQAFINNLEYQNKKGILADYSRLRHLKGSQVVFNYAINTDHLRSNPFARISINNLSKDDWYFINPKEFNALIDNTPNLRLKALYAIMYGCGLRFGEAFHLLWDKHIDFINRQIHIKNRKSNNGYPPFRIKNHQDRSIDCPGWAMDLLNKLKEQPNSKNPYVFLTDDRLKHITQKWSNWQKDGMASKWKNNTMVNNTNRNFRLYCKKAGIVTSDKLSVHCLRKAYGTNLANLGTPIHTLKDLMGHSSITTTMKFYLKSTDENKKKAVRGLEELME